MAILIWSLGGRRNIALCADNQNVLSWAERARPNAPTPNRILRPINLFCRTHRVDVLPLYVRSDRNLSADGLTRRSQHGVDAWSTREGMTRVNAGEKLWGNMTLSQDPILMVEHTPNPRAMIGRILRSPRHYNRGICECRPSNYDVAGILENWGIPVFCDHVIESASYDLPERRAPHPVPVIGDKDVFLLIASSDARSEIGVRRRTFARRRPRYSATISPFWIRDDNAPVIWTSRTSADSDTTGDPMESSWGFVSTGGIDSREFDLSPSRTEIWALNDRYRPVGQEFEEDPAGTAQTHNIPDTHGEVL